MVNRRVLELATSAGRVRQCTDKSWAVVYTESTAATYSSWQQAVKHGWARRVTRVVMATAAEAGPELQWNLSAEAIPRPNYRHVCIAKLVTIVCMS